MLKSGLVLCNCTSQIGQNPLVSKYFTMQDRQTVNKDKYPSGLGLSAKAITGTKAQYRSCSPTKSFKVTGTVTNGGSVEALRDCGRNNFPQTSVFFNLHSAKEGVWPSTRIKIHSLSKTRNFRHHIRFAGTCCSRNFQVLTNGVVF